MGMIRTFDSKCSLAFFVFHFDAVFSTIFNHGIIQSEIMNCVDGFNVVSIFLWYSFAIFEPTGLDIGFRDLTSELKALVFLNLFIFERLHNLQSYFYKVRYNQLVTGGMWFCYQTCSVLCV